MSKVFKYICMVILIIFLSAVYLKFTVHLSYWFRLLAKIPEMYLVLWLWTNWVGRDHKEKKFFMFKKKWIHYTTFITGGLFLFSASFFVKGTSQMKSIKAHPLREVSTMHHAIATATTVEVLFFTLFMIVVYLPILYFLFNYWRYSFKLYVWTYDNHAKFLFLALVFDDLLGSFVLSLFR